MSIELDALVSEYEVIKTSFQANIQAKMKTAFAQFFAKYPEFASITWSQYTPYFNDGEACEFSVGEIAYTALPHWYDEDTAEMVQNGDYGSYELVEMSPFREPSAYQRSSSYYKEKVSAWDALSDEMKARASVLDDAWDIFKDSLTNIPDDVYLDGFGDHKEITVTPDGIEVSDYDHE